MTEDVSQTQSSNVYGNSSSESYYSHQSLPSEELGWIVRSHSSGLCKLDWDDWFRAE